MSILSINGNASMNFLLKTVLTGKCKLIPVSDVFQGMNKLKQNQEVELIIIDVDYASEENWDFINHIRTSWLYAKPVIVLCSDKSDEMKEQLAEAQVYDYFFKPFSPLELVKTIQEFMHATTIPAYNKN